MKQSTLLTDKKYLRTALPFLYAVVTLVGCYCLLQYSSFARYGLRHALKVTLTGAYPLLNLLTLGVLLSILWMLCNRLWLAGLLCSVFCATLAIINYFVIKFHTMPLSFMVLRNFKTAMNVVSSYEFHLELPIVVLGAGLLGLVVLSLVFRYFLRVQPARGYRMWLRNGILAVLGTVLFYAGYLSPDPIKPVNVLGWSWEEAYQKYGYVCCTVESYFQSVNVVTEPQGYSEAAVEEMSITPYAQQTLHGSDQPDIILILNETFYDLEQVTSLNTDVPYLSGIDGMDNLLRGYAVVPGGGGGTNSTEYELLTSNSQQLMPGITPFNALNLVGAHSIVSHLNALGYATLGTHSEPAMNYSRGIAYPALGFQRALFEEAYTDTEYYQTRYYETDQSVYRNLIRWYEESPEDKPRFLYQLTIQNHGAWEGNDPEADIVHTANDYGEYTQQINEFLSCMYLSDQAFVELIEYFSTVDRPVIVCMLGDHAPIFANAIADESYTSDEVALRTRKVPLLIWANFELNAEDLGVMSVNMVVPTLLNLAQVELSPYYSYLLQVKEQLPIVSSYNVYFDREGNRYRYDSDGDNPYAQLVDQYFYLEYYNILSDKNRQLFEPYS